MRDTETWTNEEKEAREKKIERENEGKVKEKDQEEPRHLDEDLAMQELQQHLSS